MDKKININDIMWAKMQGFPPWPAIVLQPGPDVPRKPFRRVPDEEFYWVYFFGSHNYAWIEERHLKPYKEFQEKFVRLYKTAPFKEAVAEADNVLAEMENNPNYKICITEQFRGIEKNISTKRSKATSRARTKRRKSSSSSFEPNENNTDIEDSPGPCTAFLAEYSSPHAVLKTKDIFASKLTFGVLGIGVIGSGVVKNLIRSGHVVNIWNRTPHRCREIEAQLGSDGEDFLTTYLTPRAVMEHSDIVFNCFSDYNVSKKIIQSYFGINNSSDTMLEGKGLVEITGIGPESSKDIRDMIEKKGGRYLEAQVQGSKSEAMEGRLVLLTAGNKSLFFDCQSCFKAMGKTAVYLGDVGYATKINLILQLIRGVCLVGLAEGLALAERCGVSQEEFLNIFNMTSLAGAYLRGKADIIKNRNFNNVEQSLQNMQKDIKLGLELSNQIGQPMEMASVANEVFKHCRRLEYGNHDASCIYMRTRH